MILRIVASGFLLRVLIVTGLPVSAEPLTGRVVGVADGDTLIVRVAGNQQIESAPRRD